MYVSNKLVIACLPCVIWPVFSLFLIFCCYLNCLKARKLNWRNMRNSENIGHVLLKTVRRAITMLIITIWNKVFKNGPSKFVEADHISSNFLKAVFHKFYLVHSWILCPIYSQSHVSIFCVFYTYMNYLNKRLKPHV